MSSKFMCPHCNGNNCFIEERISWNPEVTEFRCFYCGFAFWENI